MSKNSVNTSSPRRYPLLRHVLPATLPASVDESTWSSSLSYGATRTCTRGSGRPVMFHRRVKCWKTSSPPRRRPSKPQQHQYTDPLCSSGVGRNNPNLPNIPPVGMGMYTAWRNRGPSPTSGADEAPRDEGKPVKSPPGAQSPSIRPFLL